MSDRINAAGSSCTGNGDFVDDTPAQLLPSDWRDSTCMTIVLQGV